MSSPNMTVYKVSQQDLTKSKVYAGGNVPVYNLAHLSQKGTNANTDYASLESVT